MEMLQRFNILLISLTCVALLVLVGGHFDQYIEAIGNFTYIPVVGAFLLVTIILIRKYKNTKAWKFFVCLLASAAIWLIAEISWIVIDVIQRDEPYPSIADVFYILGYLPMFMALLLLVFPNWNRISGDVKIIGIAISTTLLIPLVMLSQTIPQIGLTANAISLGYPILDAGLAWLVFILLVSFAKKDNFLVFIGIGVIALLIGDAGFAIYSVNDEYYTGHPIEIAFLWSYLLFAYSAYVINKNPSNLIDILQSNIQERRIKISPAFRTGLLTSIVLVLIVIVVFSINYLQFIYLSTHEEIILTYLLYGLTALMLASLTIGLIIYKRKATLSMQSKKLLQAGVFDQISVLQARIEQLEAKERKNSHITIIIVALFAAALLFYAWQGMNVSHLPDTHTHIAIIENLRGEKIDIWAIWQVEEDDVIQVGIVNANLLTDEKKNTLKTAISSERTISIRDTHSDEQIGQLSYVGWIGALKSIQNKTTYTVPTNFDIVETDRATGDIVIILSMQKDVDGAMAFTRTIVDENSNKIIRSYITIFDVKSLNSFDLAAVTRHEFGHALGLGHSTDMDSLMHPQLSSDSSFISICDINAITALYNGERLPEFICR